MSDSSSEIFDCFQEPEGYFEAEKSATHEVYRLRGGRELQLRLVGHSPLWGHHLWNAGKIIADYIEGNSSSLALNKNVLELGAGAGLPSLVCAMSGASVVTVTDYPDADLIDNLRVNVETLKAFVPDAIVHTQGLLWGADVTGVLEALPSGHVGYDVVILADLLFNHSEHQKLIDTVSSCLHRSENAIALVFFTPYRPWLLQKDLAFFDLARAAGFDVSEIMRHVMDKVMFESDPGDELLRRTVFGYKLTWRNV